MKQKSGMPDDLRSEIERLDGSDLALIASMSKCFAGHSTRVERGQLVLDLLKHPVLREDRAFLNSLVARLARCNVDRVETDR